MVSSCKLRELRSFGNSLSWADWRDRVWVQCRLDRSFGNDEWYNLFPRSQVEYMDMLSSDHRPIRVCFSYEPENVRRGRFFFDRRMLGKDGIEEVVHRGWAGGGSDVGVDLMERISNCRKELARWKKSSGANSQDRIAILKSSLQSEIALHAPDAERMRFFKRELSAAYRQEEIYWRQRSREEWLREGDQNTTYFHNCVKGKKLRNKVLMLLDEFGTEHFSEGAKGHIAVEYFRDLFMSSNPHDLESLFVGFTERVSPDMNSVLTKPVSYEEIRLAAFGIKGSSAPGEDGLTGLFYQKFWHIVGSELSAEVHNFFLTAVLPSGWNHTQISLLPKIPHPSSMKDMRPISLCSVQYKIISKILSERLKSVLEEIITDTQGAFVSGRLITDNVIIAHELIHGLRTNDSIAKEYLAVKTDMSKAYDRVEWCFLEVLLEKMGFDRQWINWVMACVSTVSYSVLLNGSLHGFIRPERGLRQGDPLSPFLFIMCAEALVGTLHQSESSGKLNGIRLGTGGPSVHHLLFADDSLLLCKANEEESAELMRCLKIYGEASGQCINYQKSSIIFGAKITEEKKVTVKGVLGIEQEGGEGAYLGLPECFKGSKHELLNFISEKLQSRLHGWYAQALSQGGK